MDNNLFAKYSPMLRNISDAELNAEIDRPSSLLIDSEIHKGRRIEIAYAPFDFVNPEAEVVIVGLTPGRQQMRNALLEARRGLMNGKSEADVMQGAKVFASFSGPMRSNLVRLLDHVGLNKRLGIRSTCSLWNEDERRAHFTSALRYPIFVDGKNFSGNPNIQSTPVLRRQLMQWCASEMRALPHALFVPLGDRVADALEQIAVECGISKDRILRGVPHPSGANAERIAFFLGNKRREDLSNKVNPERLNANRFSIERKIAMFDN